jgi:hypothetical protein
MRIWCAILVVAGAAGWALFSQRTMPYPYPTAYQFGFAYRENSVKEEAIHSAFSARYPAAEQGAPEKGRVRLTRFYPRYPDTEQGALDSWQEQRKAAPFVYLDDKSNKPRGPTDSEAKLEKEGWIAGYLESARQHP